MQHFRLVIIGDGTDRSRLEALAKEQGIEQHVLFTKYFPREQVLEAYADCDAFVFSSLTDTQGLVLLEAAAAAKPIVMVADEGLTDIVEDGENGFATPDDPQVFSEKVQTILQDTELASRFGRRSKKIAWDYSIQHQTDLLEALYEKLIHAHVTADWREALWRSLNKEIPLERLKKFPLTLTRLFRDRE